MAIGRHRTRIMKSMKTALLWGCLALILAAQQPAATARHAVIRLEQRWLAHENDAAIVGPILAPDFVHVLAQGMITKPQHLQYLRSHPHAFPGAKKFEQLRVRVYGNVAIANGVVLTAVVQQAPRRTLFTDVFVYRHGHWRAVNAQETPAAHS
ncbi:MAG: nuclear transport factor 2 family protein [Acidobacteria bacterium]|nr:MAG: nuclear transport factor 2 family protein [Acidobacteriota bacterium]